MEEFPSLKYFRLTDNLEVEECTEEEWLEETYKNRFHLVTQNEQPSFAVSTIFLGVGLTGPSFETLVIGGPCDGYMERDKTVQEAIDRHDEIVELLKQGKSPE